MDKSNSENEIPRLTKELCNNLQWEGESVFMAGLIAKVLQAMEFPALAMHNKRITPWHYVAVASMAMIRCNGQLNEYELFSGDNFKNMVTHSRNIWVITSRIKQAQKRAVEAAEYKENKAKRPKYNH